MQSPKSLGQNNSIYHLKNKVMEKFGLSDKTKEELIDIALEKDAKENQLSEELSDANSRLAQVKKELRKKEMAFCQLCIICIILMASSALLLFR